MLSNGLDLMGTGVSPRLDPKFTANIDSMMELADKTKLTQREEKHVDAMKKLAEGLRMFLFFVQCELKTLRENNRFVTTS